MTTVPVHSQRGTLRVWGYDPPHFDPQLTVNGKTQNTVSFVYSTLVRHKLGPDIQPGTFIVEPHLAEGWETPDDTTYRTGKLDAGPWHWWSVRQQDVEALKQTHPHLQYQDFLSNVSHAIFMPNHQPPFNDVRVRRAISQAIDRQAILDAVYIKGAPTPAVSRGLPEWSPTIDELGPGAKYYQYDPQEAKRLLAEAGLAKGLKTQLTVTNGLGRDLSDAAQLAQHYLKDVGIEAELKLQEYGAYMATTFAGKFEGLALGPLGAAWEPDSVLYGLYAPDQPRNTGHVNDPKITAMLKEQRRTQDREARKKIIFDLQRYIAEQQYYVYLYAIGIAGTWQPYVKNYAPNLTFNYGGRAAALWLNK